MDAQYPENGRGCPQSGFVHLTTIFLQVNDGFCSILSTSAGFHLQGKYMSNPLSTEKSALLKLLAITQSPDSVDYVNNKQQFHLYSLLTEQRHPKTESLSHLIAQDTAAGLRALLAVDEDIVRKLNGIIRDPATLSALNTAADSIQSALLHGHRVYYYGTGSTGRLAATLESGLWRPFWQKLKQMPFWHKIEQRLPNIENRLQGEITGGDRTLISSLEGFEDLQLIGKLQLQDAQITKEDVVFAMTEGGETSAVIGCILAAAEQNPQTEKDRLFFVYNNPDEVLLPFARSKSVLEHPGIHKINLATGPQAISGSTRMQATTIGLYVMGAVLQDAVYRLLQTFLAGEELAQIGFSDSNQLTQQLQQFAEVQKNVVHIADKLAVWVDKEASTYQQGGHSHYFAGKGLLCAFVDVTERSPTFRLPPLDRQDATVKKSWIEIWSPALSQAEAWNLLLHRPFKGLAMDFYQQPFAELTDSYLREIALLSLSKAGSEQQTYYDLSSSDERLRHFIPKANDLGVMFLFGDEPMTSISQQWLHQFSTNHTPVIILMLGNKSSVSDDLTCICLNMTQQDPFNLNLLIALKILLNAVSSATMAKVGRVVGNTMTNVQPSNLKLIGRATYLIQLHVNSVLQSRQWLEQHNNSTPITFAEANSVLFAAKDFLEQLDSATESAEVATSIIRILESLKKGENVSWQESIAILKKQGLEVYLNAYKNN